MVPILHTLALVTGCWCIIFIVDRILNHYEPLREKCLRLKDQLGLHVTFAYVRCYTTRLNRLFRLWTCCSRKLARTWFNLGIGTGLLLMLLSLLVLLFSLYQAFSSQSKTDQVLTPVMPGVNLPWNQIAHYIFTLIVCGIFHEVGHALAAVTEQVRINGFGLFIMYLYPGAFVDLHSDHLTVISPIRQLRIYCAGVWHNVLLTLASVLLFYSLPYLTLPFYTTGEGAVVISVAKESVLTDKLTPGSVITQIDSCTVYSSQDWLNCLMDIPAHSQKGYCIDNQYLSRHKLHPLNNTKPAYDGSRECCPSGDPSSLCYYHTSSVTSETRYICLIAREITSGATRCITNDECTVIKPHQACVTPSLGKPSHLVEILHSGPGDPVLFVGDLQALRYSIETSDYRSKDFPVWLPRLLETLCIYVGSISAALALMNMVPAYALDGQWALGALLEYIIPDYPHRTRVYNFILSCGSALLLINVVLAFWILLNW